MTFHFSKKSSLRKLTITSIFSSTEISEYKAVSLIHSFSVCSLSFWYVLSPVVGIDMVAVLINFVVLNFQINSQNPLQNEEEYSRIVDFIS